MNEPTRGRFLSTMTGLFSLLALSNATKALQSMNSPTGGFVLFGVRFETLAPNLGSPRKLLVGVDRASGHVEDG